MGPAHFSYLMTPTCTSKGEFDDPGLTFHPALYIAPWNYVATSWCGGGLKEALIGLGLEHERLCDVAEHTGVRSSK